MLFWLTQYFQGYLHVLNVFQYISFRCILSALTALLVALFIGPPMIKYLSRYRIGQPIRKVGPETHLAKAGTPTMGGALILVAITLSVVLWTDLSNFYILVVLLTTLGFGIVGWYDDYLKLAKHNAVGLRSRWKFFWQTVVGLATISLLYLHAQTPLETQLLIPFFKHAFIKLGWLYLVFGYVVIVGTSNAVNLTDGLDGLAILPTVMVAAALGVFVYFTGNINFAKYLYIPYVPNAGEVAVFCSAIVGAGLGFLWFNTYPAQVFMGDIGALGLGAAIGTVAVIARQELVLALMGGVFVLEAVSVILQVISFKLTGHRIFKMAPIHHHFELKGWPEPRVIVRFWIIAFILVLLGLATLKLR